MGLLKSKWFLLVFTTLLVIIIYMTMRKQSFTTTLECPVKSFAEFAYLPDKTSPSPRIPEGIHLLLSPLSSSWRHKIDYRIRQAISLSSRQNTSSSLVREVSLPPAPWQVETIIPGGAKGTHSFFDSQLKLARTRNGELEIWLFRNPDYDFSSLVQDGIFIVYHPKSQTWQEVSAKIENTDLIVRDLFLTSDGTIWGKISPWQEPPFPSTVSLLSKFNDSTQQFEAADGGLDILIAQDQRRSIYAEYEPEIVLDKQDIFWIFVPHDGIYRYDPKTKSIDRRANLPDPDIQLINATLSVDGSIYFEVIYPYRTKGILFQFIPMTGEILSLDLPNKTWTGNGMLVDHKGRLWLGATGYLDNHKQWQLIHPHPRENYSHLGDPGWFAPTLIFESSNGLLWYVEDNDMGLIGSGTAWYDPEKGEGCLLTNLASYIVEDAEKQLWIAIDGKLYRYSLK